MRLTMLDVWTVLRYRKNKETCKGCTEMDIQKCRECIHKTITAEEQNHLLEVIERILR